MEEKKICENKTKMCKVEKRSGVKQKPKGTQQIKSRLKSQEMLNLYFENYKYTEHTRVFFYSLISHSEKENRAISVLALRLMAFLWGGGVNFFA